MRRKAVFLDIDGTLVTFHGEFPESAQRALKIARERGHYLVISSGRTPTQIYPWLLDSGLFHGVIGGGGADVRLNGRYIMQHFLGREMLDRAIHYMEETGIVYYLQGADGVYAGRRTEAFRRKLYGNDPVRLAQREKIFGRTTYLDDIYSAEKIEKIAYYQSPVSAEEIRDAIGPGFTVTASSYSVTAKGAGEITAEGYDKARAMNCFLNVVGLSSEDSLAYGDGPNDLEILGAAGTGVAMGNAIPELKEVADQVTDPVDQDGIWNSFKLNGLIDG